MLVQLLEIVWEDRDKSVLWHLRAYFVVAALAVAFAYCHH